MFAYLKWYIEEDVEIYEYATKLSTLIHNAKKTKLKYQIK